MDPDADADLALSIPIKGLMDEFQCPICFNILSEAHMTQCGHNFCKACILECLNRKHQCPYCNHEAVKERLTRNLHLDKVISIVNKEKEEASKKYFEKLIRQRGGLNNSNGAPAPSPDGKSLAVSSSALSPIEELFHKHMKKSLATYQEYCRELKEKSDKQQDALMKEYAMKMALAGASDAKVLALKSECDQRMQQLQIAFSEQMKLLLDSYDKYMSDFAPKPAILPVTVNVAIPHKGIMLRSIVLAPTDTPKNLRDIVRDRLAQLGNPLIAWVPSNVFVWKKDSNDEILLDENVPVVMKKVEPNALLQIKGEVQLKSDEPKLCFASTFKAGDQMDYFTCKECKINWVCKNCAESCHKGHTITPYLTKHVPTWNCCYCTKMKKCTLPLPKK